MGKLNRREEKSTVSLLAHSSERAVFSSPRFALAQRYAPPPRSFLFVDRISINWCKLVRHPARLPRASCRFQWRHPVSPDASMSLLAHAAHPYKWHLRRALAETRQWPHRAFPPQTVPYPCCKNLLCSSSG